MQSTPEWLMTSLWLGVRKRKEEEPHFFFPQPNIWVLKTPDCDQFIRWRSHLEHTVVALCCDNQAPSNTHTPPKHTLPFGSVDTKNFFNRWINSEFLFLLYPMLFELFSARFNRAQVTRTKGIPSLFHIHTHRHCAASKQTHGRRLKRLTQSFKGKTEEEKRSKGGRNVAGGQNRWVNGCFPFHGNAGQA